MTLHKYIRTFVEKQHNIFLSWERQIKHNRIRICNSFLRFSAPVDPWSEEIVHDDIIFFALIAALDAASCDLVHAGVGSNHLVSGREIKLIRSLLCCVLMS